MSKKIIIALAAVLTLIIVVLIAKSVFKSNEKPDIKTDQKSEPAYSPKKPDEQAKPEMIAERIRRAQQRQRLQAREEQIMRQDIDLWLQELKKAHRENDREKVDQLIKKMEQNRKKLKTVEQLRRKLLLESRKRNQQQAKPPTEQK